MASGFVYVLQNKAFGANVLKIGLSTRAPDIRAREIYRGATGVPLPFDVAEAFSVADCKRAESLAHRRLRTYRLNLRREFFRVPLEVGTSVAFESCEQVNRELSAGTPARISFTAVVSAPVLVDQNDVQPDETDGRPVFYLDPRKISKSPVRVASLTEEESDRANNIFRILQKLNPVEQTRWLEGFMRDESPERELRIWEHIAIAYMSLQHADDATQAYRDEAFALLLQRTWHSAEQVLSTATLKHFSKSNAKRLLDAYALKPKPLLARFERGSV
jgi:hypothetical protein